MRRYNFTTDNTHFIDSYFSAGGCRNPTNVCSVCKAIRFKDETASICCGERGECSICKSPLRIEKHTEQRIVGNVAEDVVSYRGICCAGNKTRPFILPPIFEDIPDMFGQLWIGQDFRSKTFRKYLRSINNCLAMACLQVKQF